MKKTIFKKISFFLILFVLLSSYFVLVSASHADDDEGEESARENIENYREGDDKLWGAQPQLPVTDQIAPTQTISPKNERQQAQTVDTPAGQNNAAVLASLRDSDQDGIADIADQYPNQDDFAFSLIDNNHNGLADDLESLVNNK